MRDDKDGVVRYHAVRTLGKLAHVIMEKVPDSIEVVVNACLSTLTKDTYDRVRRGASAALVIFCCVHHGRPDLGNKMRQTISKVMLTESYDIVRCDCAVIMGKLGPPLHRSSQ